MSTTEARPAPPAASGPFPAHRIAEHLPRVLAEVLVAGEAPA